MFLTLRVDVKGIVPLLMHNGSLADPLGEDAKAIKELTSKRPKTDEIHRAIADLEMRGGLYLREDGTPGIPGENIEACFIEAAGKVKQKAQAKSGMFSDGFWPLGHKGPTSLAELLKDDRFRDRRGVKLSGKNRIYRVRPRFDQWWLSFDISYDDNVINKDTTIQIIKIMGLLGIGDWHPRFGRFAIEKISDSADKRK